TTAPAKVTITVAVNPPTATLELDGQTVKSPLELPYEDTDHTLLVRADGFTSKTKTIRPTANSYLDISLDSAASPEAAPSAVPPLERTSRNASTRPAPAHAPDPTPDPTQNRKKLKGPMTNSL
ncbi:MAG TPA: PEGA domain-containing protein, partial [Polyangium sp.]|nr:PEGA domain-containing protein [Polyangium sp.]